MGDMENKLKEEIDHLNKVGAEVMGNNIIKSFSPATDMNHFMMVLGEMRKRGWKFIIFLYLADKVMVDMWRTFSRTSVDAEAPVDQPALAGMRCISRAIRKKDDKEL